MADQRIKGQEIQILVVRAGELEDTLTDIQSFNVSVDQALLSVGYLGEKTNRKDYIFNGIKGDMQLHLHKAIWFQFVASQVAKAKRETPDVQFNITGVFFFPNSEVKTMLIPDVAWGEIPHNVNSRGDYLSVRLQFEASDWEVTDG